MERHFRRRTASRFSSAFAVSLALVFSPLIAFADPADDLLNALNPVQNPAPSVAVAATSSRSVLDPVAIKALQDQIAYLQKALADFAATRVATSVASAPAAATDAPLQSRAPLSAACAATMSERSNHFSNCWAISLNHLPDTEKKRVVEKLIELKRDSSIRKGRACDPTIGDWLTNAIKQHGVKPLLSSEHFSVDGTLVEAWASLKSFRARDGSDEPPSAGRNGERDFHGEKRKNDTHASTPMPSSTARARIARRSSASSATHWLRTGTASSCRRMPKLLGWTAA